VDVYGDVPDAYIDADVGEGCDRTIAEIIPGETRLEYAFVEDFPFWSVTASVTDTLDTPPVDYVQIWSNVAGGLHPRHGPSTPGTYDLSEYRIGDPSPGSNCDMCVYLFEGCPPPPAFSVCERKYIATAGTLVIEEIELWSEGHFTGLLTGAYLLEWDPLSGINPEGESVCLDRWTITANIAP
jgi:hypothetical protein